MSPKQIALTASAFAACLSCSAVAQDAPSGAMPASGSPTTAGAAPAMGSMPSAQPMPSAAPMSTGGTAMPAAPMASSTDASASSMSAAPGTMTQTTVTNGPVPDTAENRAKYGAPMSHAGKHTKPAGN